MSIFNECACAGCRVHVWAMAHAVFTGRRGPCMKMAGWERRMPCSAARRAGTCAMRMDGAWSQYAAQVQVSHRSPRAPVLESGCERVAGCRRDGGRRVALAASGLSSSGRTRTVGLSVSVDSVISIIRHTVARTRTRASFTRFGHRGGRIWPKPAAARGPRVPQPRSRRSVAVASGVPGAGRPTPRTCAPQPHPTATNRPRTKRAKTAER